MDLSSIYAELFTIRADVDSISDMRVVESDHALIELSKSATIEALIKAHAMMPSNPTRAHEKRHFCSCPAKSIDQS